MSYRANKRHIHILNPCEKPTTNPIVKGTSAIAQEGDMSRCIIKIDLFKKTPKICHSTSKAYLLQVLLTQSCQDQRSPSDVSGVFWLQLFIYIYLYMYVYIYDFCIYKINHTYIYIKIIWCSLLMALSVGPFLFWVFLGQLCHATCLLQSCYLVLMRKCVPLLWRFPLSPLPQIAAGLRAKWREKPLALLLSSAAP